MKHRLLVASESHLLITFLEALTLQHWHQIDHPISPFDMSRSMRLNPKNETVAQIYGFVGLNIERVRLDLERQDRERRNAADAKKLEKEASAIAEIVNKDFATSSRSLPLAVTWGAPLLWALANHGEHALPFPTHGPLPRASCLLAVMIIIVKSHQNALPFGALHQRQVCDPEALR